MDDLTTLAIKYGTDKWGKHHYTPVYYDIFKNKKDKVKKVLEIGTAEGAGTKMFRDFFPNATIYGAEIDEKRVEMMKGEERIEVYKCDQTKIEDLLNLIHKTGTDIDLVIDDGSHNPEDQIFTCLTLLRLLDKDSIYVIEDVADIGIVDTFHYLKLDYQRVEVGTRYDDRLIIVKI